MIFRTLLYEQRPQNGFEINLYIIYDVCVCVILNKHEIEFLQVCDSFKL